LNDLFDVTTLVRQTTFFNFDFHPVFNVYKLCVLDFQDKINQKSKINPLRTHIFTL